MAHLHSHASPLRSGSITRRFFALAIVGMVLPIALLTARSVTQAASPDAHRAFVEDLGPRFHTDWTNPASPDANGNAYHWTRLMGIPFTSDVHIDLHDVALDLDADGKVDLRFTKKIDLVGGAVANPEAFGLVPTPYDPAGTAGPYSISTGFSGIREEIDPQTHKGTGRYGFTCAACHGGVSPKTGRVVPGLTNSKLYWGLLLAGSEALQPDHVIDVDGDGKPDSEDYLQKRHRLGNVKLDADVDGKITIREFRKALRFEPCEQVQARLLLDGPGRQDLSHEFGQDETVPGLMRIEYADGYDDWIKRLRPAIFNPVSVLSPRGLAGVDCLNNSGNDTSLDIDYVERIGKLTGKSVSEIATWLGTETTDRHVLNRFIAFDKRTLETFSQDADTWWGLEWSDVLSIDRNMNAKRFLDEIPSTFNTKALRAAILDEFPPEARCDGLDPKKVARGSEIFSRAIVGTIKNQQVRFRAPTKYRKQGMPRDLYLAPIDDTKPLSARIQVRCATCHNYSCSDEPVSYREIGDVQGRCVECHAPCPKIVAGGESLPTAGTTWSESCVKCHETHPKFGTQSYSRSMIFPFDGDADGVIQGDEAEDGAAGGIGTDSMYMVNPMHQVLSYDALDEGATPPTIERRTLAFGWIRVTPLRAVFATAPYLHNGSVPTLRDLLRSPDDRPKSFPLGTPKQDFTLDTSLPGNHRTGHDFGTKLSDDDKDALVEFLKSL
ncbi:MAG: hypothetical protein HYR85_10035 [Planctomycetes bacterium]|nr:hypothetical protein [Planctomycetota bacterium]MBI3846631.1 hypothetical protein [Planctomycetota bacterium]